VRVGLKLMPQAVGLDDLRAVWQIADDAGFDHCWIFDHFLPTGAPPEADVYECWSLLAAMAQATKRVRLGALVTGNTYRHPGVLAKIAVTVDRLSNGRLEFAIGTGWAEEEHTMLGLELGTPGQRIARLDEACTVFKLLWTGERVSFDGAHYRLDGALARPLPVQRPHPPIWIGTRGERKALRVVARHADAWNISANNVRTMAYDVAGDARLSRVLDAHCESIGRDPAAIRRTAQLLHAGDADATLRMAEQYAEAGFGELIVSLAGSEPVPEAEAVADDLLPRLRDLA
jgi:F420-dependent oxidoreductase-like protein